jgi:signal transduction histidine kinase
MWIASSPTITQRSEGGRTTNAAPNREARICHIMKQKLTRLSRRYAWALKKYLTQGPRGNLQPARGLGVQAVKLGLETLDVAKIHEETLAALEAFSSRDGVIKRAEIFFTEAVTPIEKTHHAALKTTTQLYQVNKTLDQRTVDLVAANQSLKQGIARRKTVEKALKASGGDSKKLLKESRRLQKHLQHLTHQVMAAQEDQRKQISRELQDEIAQTLLGINVRLLTLKKEAAISTESFKKEIASTERLVDKSMRSIKRFAREFCKHHES